MKNNLTEMKETIEFMLENMELLRKQAELNGALTRISFDTLRKAGFSDEQAMELIKARGPLLS